MDLHASQLLTRGLGPRDPRKGTLVSLDPSVMEVGLNIEMFFLGFRGKSGRTAP